MKHFFLKRYFSFQHHVFIEIKTSLPFILPLVLTQLLDGMMGLVDTMVAGRLNVVAIASLAAANGLFWAVICVISGLFSGLDTYIPRSFGEQNQTKLNQLLIQGLWIALLASCITILMVLLCAFAYDFSQTPREVVTGMWQYLAYLLPSAPLILIMTVIQRYWQSQNHVKPFVFLMIAMNVLNLLLDLALVEGWFGHSFDVNGIALSTFLCRVFALIFVIVWSFQQWKKQGVNFHQKLFHQYKPNLTIIRQILNIGIPSLGHLAADVFAFNLMTFLASQLGVIPLAAHQIMFMVTCITVMVPIGIANAACIRIGQLIGAKDEKHVMISRHAHLLICFICMSASGAFLYCKPLVIINLFTTDSELIDSLIFLMQLCGLLQIADGMQMVYVGILRAYGEVRRVFIFSLIAHYSIGLPLGLVACYLYDLGVIGLWIGVTAALFSSWAFYWILGRSYLPANPKRFGYISCKLK